MVEKKLKLHARVSQVGVFCGSPHVKSTVKDFPRFHDLSPSHDSSKKVPMLVRRPPGTKINTDHSIVTHVDYSIINVIALALHA